MRACVCTMLRPSPRHGVSTINQTNQQANKQTDNQQQNKTENKTKRNEKKRENKKKPGKRKKTKQTSLANEGLVNGVGALKLAVDEQTSQAL